MILNNNLLIFFDIQKGLRNSKMYLHTNYNKFSQYTKKVAKPFETFEQRLFLKTGALKSVLRFVFNYTTLVSLSNNNLPPYKP